MNVQADMEKLGYKQGAISLGDAGAMALTFVLFVIIVAIGGDILSGVQSSQNTASVSYNITSTGLDGLTNLGNYSDTIGTIMGAAVIVGIVLIAFGAYSGMNK